MTAPTPLVSLCLVLACCFSPSESFLTVRQGISLIAPARVTSSRSFPIQHLSTTTPKSNLPSFHRHCTPSTTTTTTTTTTLHASSTRSSSSRLRHRREHPVGGVPDDAVWTDAAVCGGGPAGLLTAVMLAQKFPQRHVSVFDRLPPPPSPTDDSVWSGDDNVAKFYLIGLGGRGQSALRKFGVWEEVKDCCTAVVGRKDWAPESDEGVERIFSDRPVTTQVLPRDKLVGVLHKHIGDNYSSDQIELNYGCEVMPIDFGIGGDTSTLIQINKCRQDAVRANPTSMLLTGQDQPSQLCDTDESYTVVTNLLVAADGTSRTIANKIEQEDKLDRQSMHFLRRLFAGPPFRVKRYVDDNQRIYKTVPLKLPHKKKDWRHDLNYSARTKGGRVTFDALPADRNGTYCGVLLLKKDDPLAAADTDPAELRALFDEALPQFSALVDDATMEAIAKKPPSYLPGFRYVGPRLHQGERTVLLGDSAHTVKPYFGLGANSALEDVVFLANALDETENISDAVHLFSRQRAGEAKALVKLSRELDRPGKLGFITFILPLILDSIFHKVAPMLFETNTIAMLQREGYGFRRVQLRKRRDRIGQMYVLGFMLTGMVAGVKFAVNSIAHVLGRKSSTVAGAVLAAAAGLLVAKKLTEYLVPGMAPADVLAKSKYKGV